MITVPYLPKEVVDLARGPMFLKFKHTDSLSTFIPLLNTSVMCSYQSASHKPDSNYRYHFIKMFLLTNVFVSI